MDFEATYTEDQEGEGRQHERPPAAVVRSLGAANVTQSAIIGDDGAAPDWDPGRAGRTPTRERSRP